MWTISGFKFPQHFILLTKRNSLSSYYEESQLGKFLIVIAREASWNIRTIDKNENHDTGKIWLSQMLSI